MSSCANTTADLSLFLSNAAAADSASKVTGYLLTTLTGEGVTGQLTVDGVVISRERWSVPTAGLGFARLTDALGQWLEARRWQRGLGLPRFAFFKVETERKPCFVDFDSPLLVEMMAKLVRRAAEEAPQSRVHFSEMLPDLGHLWLTDAALHRYTSELRVICELR